MDERQIKVPIYTSFLKCSNLQLDNDSKINDIKVKDLMDNQVTTFTGEEALYMVPQVFRLYICYYFAKEELLFEI